MSSHPTERPSSFCRRFDGAGDGALPTTLRCARDALEVIAAAIHVPRRSETVALLLDEDRRGRTIVVVDGTKSPDAVIDVVECLTDNMASLGGGNLVLASVRPDLGVLPGDSDRWMEASDIAEERGCVLLDWFVITDGGACCVPDLVGEVPRW